MTHIDFLRNVSLFESLNQEELEALSDVTFTRTFSKDNVIILAEEEGDTLFILKRGQVKVSIVSEEGREVILSLLGSGSVFGELSLLDGKPRSANVVAIEETELLMLTAEIGAGLVGGSVRVGVSVFLDFARPPFTKPAGG